VSISAAPFLGADNELVAFDVGVICLSSNQFSKFRGLSYTTNVPVVT